MGINRLCSVFVALALLGPAWTSTAESTRKTMSSTRKTMGSSRTTSPQSRRGVFGVGFAASGLG